jgi:adenylate cyclase
MQRKLTALFSADVEGYSRLMGDDEIATIRTLTEYREVMTAFIQVFRGAIVDSPGDNLLAEFASAIDAVQGAVEIQRELKTRNTALPPHRKMEFRIGINVGDVVVEGQRLYGDGVNIAARLEGLAEGGGICISGAVYDQVENKLSLEYEYLGEQAVKNITKPVRAYWVRLETHTLAPAVSGKNPVKPRHRQRIALAVAMLLLVGAGTVVIKSLFSPSVSLPVITPSEPASALESSDKPAIVVLPFTNMSGDQAQDYFSDGISEDLITDLSKLSGLLVISRHSSFTYKGKAVKVEDVGRELGVRYVVEGSVRKGGDKVRITTQLVDVTTGGHLWAERYDRDLTDIFPLQDEITQHIVLALKVKLTQEEQARFRRAPTDDLQAYDFVLRGWDAFFRHTKETNAQARQMFEKAIELDPEYAGAYAFLSLTYFQEWDSQWNRTPQTLEQAFTLAQHAVALDDTLSTAHSVLSFVHLWNRQHEQAITEAKRAIALDPNNADCYVGLGFILNLAGEPNAAIELVKNAMRLNPRYSSWYAFNLGLAYRLTGRYEEAIAIHKQALLLTSCVHNGLLSHPDKCQW